MDLDHDEILRTVRLGIETGRLPEGTGTDVGEILDRLKLREEQRLLNGAVILFASKIAKINDGRIRPAEWLGNSGTLGRTLVA